MEKSVNEPFAFEAHAAPRSSGSTVVSAYVFHALGYKRQKRPHLLAHSLFLSLSLRKAAIN